MVVQIFLKKLKTVTCILPFLTNTATSVSGCHSCYLTFKTPVLNEYIYLDKLYYDAKEEAIRRDVWEKNLQFVDLHNYEASQGKHTFTVRMNKFADLVSVQSLLRDFQSRPRSTKLGDCCPKSYFKSINTVE